MARIPDLEPGETLRGKVIEVLVNDVSLEGMRRVKVVSDAPIEPAVISPSPCPLPLGEENMRTWCDELLGLHYLEATWACREAIKIRCEGWKIARPFVLWKLAPGERVSEALKEILGVFGALFKCFPDYAFMKKLPKTVENGFEVDGVMFMEAVWVPASCVAVCKGDDYGFETMAL